MSESNKSYRIRTKVGRDNTDKYINVNLTQDFNTFEILSMKVDATNFYKLQSSNYGCIAGRVLANGGVGVPNAKISIFIPSDEETANDVILSELYPFTTAFSKDSDGVRYNLFPDTEVKLCHTKIGTFPEKRLALDDEKVSKVFKKYYKYTTRTNTAGDYMIFGVPVGEHVVHTDIDLSDIGVLSQKPIDMMYKGFNINQFENPKKFKTDTNIDSLAQVISQNDSVYVFPFWGDGSESQIKITRNDIDIQYKFEPSCVFIGSLVTDDNSNGMQTACVPTEDMGKMSSLTTGYGTIEMIRKTPNGEIEEFTIQGNQLIDGNGTWCYQIPMNLDYYMTDEYGNMVPSDDSSRGIPTRTRVRFRVSLGNFKSDHTGIQIVKMLVPNNPHQESEIDYHFGSMTKDDKYGTLSFRDLFWNNVYTVKSYIPRIQKSGNVFSKEFTGFKDVNSHASNNPIPYNNMQVHISNTFTRQCNTFRFLLRITQFLNRITGNCTVVGDGMCPNLENWYFAPGCKDKNLDKAKDTIRYELDKKSTDEKNSPTNSKSSFCLTNQIDYLVQCVEIHLAMENDVVQFNFFNDWINGLLYIPKWFVNIKKKTNYFFGTITTPARLEGCMESNFNGFRNFVQQCALKYSMNTNHMYTKVSSRIGCSSKGNGQNCHKADGFKFKRIFGENGGLVHTEQTMTENYVYYAKPAEWNNNGVHVVRCPLFATDIVMLGSLNNFDEVGIPNAFEELLPTTYRLPKSIAVTNMDNIGYMYGIANRNKGTKCVGLNVLAEPMEVYPQTFENYAEWSKNSDNNDSPVNPSNSVEYPITIASGIDWGYHGPDQGQESPEDIYYPGGHFLAMSCKNSAVNIKSCVNLSRICEIGTTISQRHELVTGVKSDNEYELQYSSVIPSGLINRYDITDGNFRKMFASMNHNRLKTKINKDTAYLEYDIIPLNPKGFTGELEDFVKGSNNYNGKVKSDVDRDGVSTDTFVSTIEIPDSDYYRFRMGLNEAYSESDLTDRYLWQQSSEVAIPVYENSFYFYFGLKDGSTALDRFFKDFYAKCDTTDNDLSYVMTETTPTNGCGNSESDLGSCEVWINDVDSPYTMMLKMNNPSSPYDTVLWLDKMRVGDSSTPYTKAQYKNTGNLKNTRTHNYSHFHINGLRGGKYMLTIASEGAGNVTVTFTIEETIPEDVDNIKINIYDFAEEYTNYDETELANRVPIQIEGGYKYDDGGYIVIDNVHGDQIAGIAVYTDAKYLIIPKKINYSSLQTILNANGVNTNIMDDVTYKPDWKKVKNDIETYYIPAWRGNDSYSVMFITTCLYEDKEDDTKYKTYSYNRLSILMNGQVDVYVGDSDLTYRYGILDLMEHISELPYGTWYEALLFTDADTLSAKLHWDLGIIEKRKWNLKEAIYYRGTMYTDEDNGVINIYPANGTTPYIECASGKTEEWVDKTVNNSSGGYITHFNKKTSQWNGSWINTWNWTNTMLTARTVGNSKTLTMACELHYETDKDNELEDVSYMHSFHTPTSYIGNKTEGNSVKPEIKLISPLLFKGINNPNSFNDNATRISYNGMALPSNFTKRYNRANPNPVPHYKYAVTDAKGNKIPTFINPSGNEVPFELPSIYRPTYVNVRRTYIKEADKYCSYTSISIVNPILYGNEIGKIEIGRNNKTNNYTVRFNQGIDKCLGQHDFVEGFLRFNNGTNGMYMTREFINDKAREGEGSVGVYDYIISYWNIEQLPNQDDGEISQDDFENPRISVEYEDGTSGSYDGIVPIYALREERACVFPTKDRPMYDIGVRFYVVDRVKTRLWSPPSIYNIMKEYALSTLPLNDYTRTGFLVKDHTSDVRLGAWNGLFGGKITNMENGTYKQYDLILRDVTSDVYEALSSGETVNDKWLNFVKCAQNANELSDENAVAYNNILAIYDKWTLAECSTDRDPKNMFEYVTPDENILSLVKLYGVEELYG